MYLFGLWLSTINSYTKLLKFISRCIKIKLKKHAYYLFTFYGEYVFSLKSKSQNNKNIVLISNILITLWSKFWSVNSVLSNIKYITCQQI